MNARGETVNKVSDTLDQTCPQYNYGQAFSVETMKEVTEDWYNIIFISLGRPQTNSPTYFPIFSFIHTSGQLSRALHPSIPRQNLQGWCCGVTTQSVPTCRLGALGVDDSDLQIASFWMQPCHSTVAAHHTVAIWLRAHSSWYSAWQAAFECSNHPKTSAEFPSRSMIHSHIGAQIPLLPGRSLLWCFGRD